MPRPRRGTRPAHRERDDSVGRARQRLPDGRARLWVQEAHGVIGAVGGGDHPPVGTPSECADKSGLTGRDGADAVASVDPPQRDVGAVVRITGCDGLPVGTKRGGLQLVVDPGQRTTDRSIRIC